MKKTTYGICPYCRNKKTNIIYTEVEDNYILITRSCEKCNNNFGESYIGTYVGFTIIDNNDNEIDYDVNGELLTN